ncbi:MAG: hypothetical protein ACI9VS_002553 [Candidatus Binatia bacterium]|jgi:hypothetical protein
MKKNDSPRLNLKKLLLAAFCALSLTTLSGCIAAAAGGAAAAYYVTSDVDYVAPVKMDKAWEATLAGLKDMNLLAEAKSPGETTSKVEALTGDDRRVRISLKSESAEVTAIYVRVGIKGDKVLSGQIMDKIKSRF